VALPAFAGRPVTSRRPFGGPSGHWLGRRDPRLLLVVTGLFAVVTVSLQTLAAATVALGFGVAAAAAGGLPFRSLLKRLAALEALMAVLLATLPFTVAGDAVLSLGPLTATREGANAAALIFLRANAVVLVLLGLLGGLEPVVLGHALARLGVPHKLVHLLLLTISQIKHLDDERWRLRRAMRARAFVPRSNRHTWVSYGNLIGMLLVRSLERARRIEAAMRARGFQGRLYLLDDRHWRLVDTVSLVVLVPFLAGLLALDRLP
jgi:cobalt/nickel transport system permease protein